LHHCEPTSIVVIPPPDDSTAAPSVRSGTPVTILTTSPQPAISNTPPHLAPLSSSSSPQASSSKSTLSPSHSHPPLLPTHLAPIASHHSLPFATGGHSLCVVNPPQCHKSL
jgi:hypothetical protein